MEVVAYSIVANAAAGVSDVPISHADVLAAVSRAAPRVGDLIENLIGKLHKELLETKAFLGKEGSLIA